MSSSRKYSIRLLFEKIFGKHLMKMKAVKPCGKMTVKNVKRCLTKKRRKASNRSKTGGEVSSLITSTTHRQGLDLVQRTTAAVKKINKHACFDHLATQLNSDMNLSKAKLSTTVMYDTLANAKVLDNPVVEASLAEFSDCAETLNSHDSHDSTVPSAVRTSLLETIFSPVFHLFKGNAGEGSASCTTTVDHGEELDGVDSVGPVATEGTAALTQETKSGSTKAAPNATVEASLSTVRVVSSSTLSLSSEQALSSTSRDNNAVLTCDSAVDIGDECLGWIHMDHKPLEGTTQGYDQLEEEEMLDSDPTSLFLSVPHARSLECADSSGEKEPGGSEDSHDLNEFDPYLFIKHLPDLSEVVPTFRPSLLPRQTRHCPEVTLVLDLDETLVHSTLEYCEDADFTFPVHFNLQEHTVYVKCRPYLQVFLERVAELFEIIVFTASQSIYAEQLLNILDPKRKLIRHRVFRDSCVFVEGNYLKDLTVLGRDLSKVAIVDNSPQAFGFQIDNGIPIESWFDDRSDCALAMLLPFLESLVGVDDVRPIIAKKYNLRNKIVSALQTPAIANREFSE